MGAAIIPLPTETASGRRRKLSKQEEADQVVIRQIDELQRVSEEERDRHLGPQWLKEMRDFYELTGYTTVVSPSFRPRIVIPELQSQMLAEATDISESSPKVFILDKEGKRDKIREKSYQEHWRQQQYGFQILLGELWSLFGGTAFWQVGVDPLARRGKGEVWMYARGADVTFPDPGVIDRVHWVYVVLEDKLYVDEICRLWPEVAPRIRRGTRGYISTNIGENAGTGLTLPEGPMRYGSGHVEQRRIVGDGRLVVRQVFIDDYSTEELSKQERAMVKDTLGPLGVAPARKLKYPKGRWIVDCPEAGVVCADGDSWVPLKLKPVVPIQSMPQMGSFWVPPPVRYTKNLQGIAERMLTGVFENAVRVNNAMVAIDERTGIDPNNFGGIPAEVIVINAGSPPPTYTWPQPMPQHFVTLPELLLSKQRAIQGFSGMRQGEPQPGNIAQGLFDASVFQSQVLTRMRAKLMAPSVQALAELVFYTMCRYYKQERSFPGFGGDLEMVPWKKPADPEDYDVYLDPGSIKPTSSSALRALVIGLMDKGKLPLKYALEQLELPGAEEIAEEQRKEMELSAILKLKRPR